MVSAPTFTEFNHSGHRVKFEIRDPNDFVQKMIAETSRFYEEPLLMDAASIIEPGSLCIDVGANIGNHTVFLAKICRAHVVAIEPSDEHMSLLKSNLEHNDIVSLVTPIQAAAGQEKGSASLHVSDLTNTGRARMLHGAGDIEVIRIDDLLLDHPVALMKIDVEGMELEVLKGARETLQRDRPVLYAEASTPSEFAAVEKYLAGIGYAQMGRFNATATYRFDSANDQEQINRIFLRSLAGLRAEVREIGLKVRKLPILKIE